MKVIIVLILGSSFMASTAFAQLGTGVKRIHLQKHDLSVPGYEMVQSRVEISVGVTAPKHRHPGEEIVNMIEGSLEYTLEGQPPVTLNPGQVLFIPAGTYHSVRNVGKSTASELATYIVEKGKPLVEISK